MKTYPIFTKDGVRLIAFEIDNSYFFFSHAGIVKILGKVGGVTDIQKRRLFAILDEVHVKFKYLGQPYIVWEPFGDNSRYWIGPEGELETEYDITPLENSFKTYHPLLS